MSVCNVDLEPHPPVDAASKRWQRTPTGPFFEQHVRVYDNSTAGNVLAALKTALAKCRRYTATDSRGGSSSFEVSGLTLRSADARTVSWRQKLVPAAASTTAATTTASTATPGGRVTAPSATTTSSATATTALPVLTQDVAVTRIGSSTVMLVSYAVNETPSVAILDAAVSAARALP